MSRYSERQQYKTLQYQYKLLVKQLKEKEATNARLHNKLIKTNLNLGDVRIMLAEAHETIEDMLLSERTAMEVRNTNSN